MKFYDFSHRGHRRERNEDAILVREDMNLIAAFDGCGGHAGGDVASATAAQAVAESVDIGPAAATARVARVVALHKATLHAAFVDANRAVAARARESAMQDMATTGVAALFGPGVITIAHLGDSRCYLVRQRSEAHLLTVDHTMRNALLAAGDPADEVDALPKQYLECLVGVLGPYKEAVPTVNTFYTEPGDVVLLCTDGVYRELSPRQMRDALLELDPAAALLAACLKTRCHDNVSGVVVQIL